MKTIALIIFLATSLHLLGQNRIPFNGENIQFYPINKDNIASSEGYDCFYDKGLVVKNGKYSFKPKYRLNKNENNTTSFDDIEGYTFNVLNYEILNDNTEKEILLLFLRRNEDDKEIVMRVPCYTDKKSNRITQSFLKYKRKDKYSLTNTTTYVYVNLPFVNVDSLSCIKQEYENSPMVFDRVYSQEYKNRTEDFDIIVKNINGGRLLKSHKVYNCTDISFRKIYTKDIFLQLCANVTDDTGEIFTIPITYFAGNNTMYDPNNGSSYYFTTHLFKTKAKYLHDECKIWKCENIVTKFSGQSVYYGLKGSYNYTNDIIRRANTTEIRTLNDMESYIITEGTYECLGFEMQECYEEDYSSPIPFAILKDKNGVCFRTPAPKIQIGPSYFKTYSERFDNYFVLKEEADSIIKQRIEAEQKAEINKNNKLKALTKEYGKSYADFLIEKNDKTIERFCNLAKRYGKQNAKTIIEGNVKIGWSKEMCREAWGRPDKINTTRGIWGVHEQWVYEYSDEFSYDIFCLYFENGILTTIQD